MKIKEIITTVVAEIQLFKLVREMSEELRSLHETIVRQISQEIPRLKIVRSASISPVQKGGMITSFPKFDIKWFLTVNLEVQRKLDDPTWRRPKGVQRSMEE